MNIPKSIKLRMINPLLILITALLYSLNNGFIKNATHGWFGAFFSCYFNDLICPLFLLSYSNLLLVSINREITSLRATLLLCFASGIVWEYLAPYFKSNAVSDPNDILCYLLGSYIYWLILRRFSPPLHKHNHQISRLRRNAK